jgi:CspA family cold shock protein
VEVGFEGGISMPKGTIRRLITDRGFGFIRVTEGLDLLFHRNELQGVGFSSLREGQEVEFEVGRGRNGRTGKSTREGGKRYPMSIT